ncbi:hypothetical protein SNEBB_008990 [Seison nebaliae]|nr:hypothetical protein SNEBB_008990 [Seison nebaliae]
MNRTERIVLKIGKNEENKACILPTPIPRSSSKIAMKRVGEKMSQVVDRLNKSRKPAKKSIQHRAIKRISPDKPSKNFNKKFKKSPKSSSSPLSCDSGISPGGNTPAVVTSPKISSIPALQFYKAHKNQYRQFQNRKRRLSPGVSEGERLTKIPRSNFLVDWPLMDVNSNIFFQEMVKQTNLPPTPTLEKERRKLRISMIEFLNKITLDCIRYGTAQIQPEFELIIDELFCFQSLNEKSEIFNTSRYMCPLPNDIDNDYMVETIKNHLAQKIYKMNEKKNARTEMNILRDRVESFSKVIKKIIGFKSNKTSDKAKEMMEKSANKIDWQIIYRSSASSIETLMKTSNMKTLKVLNQLKEMDKILVKYLDTTLEWFARYLMSEMYLAMEERVKKIESRLTNMFRERKERIRKSVNKKRLLTTASAPPTPFGNHSLRVSPSAETVTSVTLPALLKRNNMNNNGNTSTSTMTGPPSVESSSNESTTSENIAARNTVSALDIYQVKQMTTDKNIKTKKSLPIIKIDDDLLIRNGVIVKEYMHGTRPMVFHRYTVEFNEKEQIYLISYGQDNSEKITLSPYLYHKLEFLYTTKMNNILDKNMFHDRLVCLCQRYRTLTCNDELLKITSENDPRMPSRKVQQLLKKRFGVNCELFASPFSTITGNYCSIFPDVDGYFGSFGTIQDFLPQSCSVLIRPEILRTFDGVAYERIKELLKKSNERNDVLFCFLSKNDYSIRYSFPGAKRIRLIDNDNIISYLYIVGNDRSLAKWKINDIDEDMIINHYIETCAQEEKSVEKCAGKKSEEELNNSEESGELTVK